MSRTFVALGTKSVADDLWLHAGVADSVVRFEHAAPSGYRWGSRAFGLGADSVAVALKAFFRRGYFIAANPWIAVALKLTGKARIATTGIYAAPGSRSFQVLRAILRNSPVVTTVAVEAASWNAAGGIARPVLYGNDFGYPVRVIVDDHPLRIFVGGASDRDPLAVAKLEDEVRSSKTAVSLVIVEAGTSSDWRNDLSSITRTGYVSAERFGQLISGSDVVFLPVRQGGRAAGHMVTVGSLEAGVPVLTAKSNAMEGYVDGHFVREAIPGSPLLPQLRSHAEAFRVLPEAVRAYWAEHLSRNAFVLRVAEALNELRFGEPDKTP